MQLDLSILTSFHDPEVLELDDVRLLRLGGVGRDLLCGREAVIANRNEIAHPVLHSSCGLARQPGRAPPLAAPVAGTLHPRGKSKWTQGHQLRASAPRR